MRAFNYRGQIENILARHLHPSSPDTRLSIGNASKEINEHYKAYFEQEAKILEDFGMKYSAAYTGMKEPEGWGQLADCWTITLTNNSTGKAFSLDYKQGLGHRYIKTSEYNSRRAEAFIVTPKPLDILSCIRSDDPQGYSFEDWCMDFDFDTDSRKVLEMYLACQQQTNNFRRAFPGVDLNEYEPLENY